MTTAASTKIRADLKAAGYGTKDVSVRNDSYSMGSSVRVRIKRAEVPLDAVEAIANKHEKIDRDDATGEILSGGNMYVDVAYDSDALKDVALRIISQLAAGRLKFGPYRLNDDATDKHAVHIWRHADGDGHGKHVRTCYRDSVHLSLAETLARAGEIGCLDNEPDPTDNPPEGVELSIEITQDETPVPGNALASGDRATDLACEIEIIERLDAGDVLAWCVVRIVARETYDAALPYLPREGVAVLGAISVHNKRELWALVNAHDMRDEAIRNMHAQDRVIDREQDPPPPEPLPPVIAEPARSPLRLVPRAPEPEPVSFQVQPYAVRLLPDGPPVVLVRKKIDSFDDAAAVFQTVMRNLPHEEVWAIGMNAKNEPVGIFKLAQGGIHGCALQPCDVFRPLVACNACGYVLAHNHPSGDPTPSADDISMTRKLRDAGAHLGIVLLDHLVITNNGHDSIIERL